MAGSTKLPVPLIAIVGRPNVGKSTFFNRCVGARHAIVDDAPGVTRDLIYAETDWAGQKLLLIDTGGIVQNNESLSRQIFDQVMTAVDEADVLVFMVDGKAGISGTDEEIANLLRKSGKPVVLAVNKTDLPNDENNALEFYKLGLGEPVTMSALRGTGGVGDVLDRILASLGKAYSQAKQDKKRHQSEEDDAAPEEDQPLAIAFVGKPNVGKSSIVNLLCGRARSVVSAEPGTTRDALDSKIKIKGKEYLVVDTAGIRRKNKVVYGVEAFAVSRSLRAITRADVVVLILDATCEISDQDQKIAAKIDEAGKAAVIVYNKWDLVDDRSSKAMNQFINEAHTQLSTLSFAEVLFVSTLTRQRVHNIIEAAERAVAQTKKRITTALVNQVVNEAVALTPPPSLKRGKRLKIYYATQVAVAPPTFVLFANDTKLMARSYELYLTRKIRQAFGYAGTPIRLLLRAGKGANN